MTAANEALEFSATTTLDDVLAAEVNQTAVRTKTPWWRRPRVIFLAFLVVGIVGGGLSTSDDPTGFLKALATTKIGVLALVYFAMIALFLSGLRRGLKAVNEALKR